MKIISHNNLYKSISFILPIYFIIALIEFYNGWWGLSAIVKLFAFVLIILLSKYVFFNSPKSNIRTIFTIYYYYCIGSIIWYAINDISIKCYLNEVYNSIPAMFFFYIGLEDKNNCDRFDKLYFSSCTISMAIGLLLYFTTPEWFILRRQEIVNSQWFAQFEYSESDVLSAMRFSSYLGDTYEVDVYAIMALSIGLNFLFFNRDKFSKGDNWLLFFIIINFASAILCQQRVAMAYATMLFIFYIFYGYRKNCRKAVNKFVLLIACSILLLIPIIGYYFGDRIDYLQLMLSDRMDNMSLSKAMGERDQQINLLIYHWTNPIFGNGIGSGGSIARSMGYHGVSDASYIEILYEVGIIGFLLFSLIILKSIFRGLKYFKFYLKELVIIGFSLVACIGSNTLSMGFLCTFPFWYYLGRIWNPYLINHYSTNSKY